MIKYALIHATAIYSNLLLLTSHTQPSTSSRVTCSTVVLSQDINACTAVTLCRFGCKDDDDEVIEAQKSDNGICRYVKEKMWRLIKDLLADVISEPSLSIFKKTFKN